MGKEPAIGEPCISDAKKQDEQLGEEIRGAVIRLANRDLRRYHSFYALVCVSVNVQRAQNQGMGYACEQSRVQPYDLVVERRDVDHLDLGDRLISWGGAFSTATSHTPLFRTFRRALT